MIDPAIILVATLCWGQPQTCEEVRISHAFDSQMACLMAVPMAMDAIRRHMRAGDTISAWRCEVGQ